MENKYKKILAKIAAIFSIIAVFSIGFINSKVYANDPKGDIQTKENIAAENISDIDDNEMQEFLNSGEVSEVQDGPESPYYQAISQDHIDAAKSIHGEAGDPYIKLLKAYEAQEALRAALKAKKENPYESYHDARIADLHAQHKEVYAEHHDVNQKEIPKLIQRAEYLENKKNRTEEDNKKLSQYKALAMSSGSTPAESPAKNSARQIGKSQEKLNEAERRYNILAENDPNKAQAKKEYDEIAASHYALGKLYHAQSDLEAGRKGSSEENVKAAESAYKDIVTKVKNGAFEIAMRDQNAKFPSIDKDGSAENIGKHLDEAQKNKKAAEQRYEYLSQNNDPDAEPAKKKFEEDTAIHSALVKLYRAQSDLESGRKGASEENVKIAEAEFKLKLAELTKQSGSKQEALEQKTDADMNINKLKPIPGVVTLEDKPVVVKVIGISKEDSSKLENTVLYGELAKLNTDLVTLNKMVDFYESKNNKDPYYFATVEGRNILSAISKRAKEYVEKEATLQVKAVELSRQNAAQEVASSEKVSVPIASVAIDSEAISQVVPSFDIEMQKQELLALRNRWQEMQLTEDRSVGREEKDLLNKYIKMYESLIVAEERSKDLSDSSQVQVIQKLFDKSEREYKNFISELPAPKITKADLAVLEGVRDAAGAEYSKNLGLGVNDPENVKLAEESYVTGKKLLDAQNELRAAGGESKDAQKAQEVKELSNKYDHLEAAIQVNLEKEKKQMVLQLPMPGPKSKSEVLRSEPEVAAGESKAPQVDSQETEQKQIINPGMPAPKPKPEILEEMPKIAIDEHGDYIVVRDDQVKRKARAKKKILPVIHFVYPDKVTNHSVTNDDIEEKSKNDWRSSIWNDALSQ